MTPLLAASSCDSANSHDVTGISYVQPDSTTVWANIDQHPNVARVCLDGLAFATTSRDGYAADQRVVEWDKFCPPAKAPVLQPTARTTAAPTALGPRVGDPISKPDSDE